MRFFITVVITVAFILTLNGCDEDKVTGDSEDLVPVKVDIGDGLQGHQVFVEFNGESYFAADLTESAPFAGPIATFTTHLPRGSNTCNVYWKKDTWHEDSTDFILGDSGKYFISIPVASDTTLVFMIQDTPFGYI